MVRCAGANMETVRRKNRAAILKYINDGGPASRKDLAGVLGLTPAAVTQICTDLMEEGVLAETGINVERSGAGRKKVLLDLNYDAAYVYAINVEPQYTTVAISNLKGEKIALERIGTNPDIPAEEYLMQIAKLCRKLGEKYPNEAAKIAAVGVGVTGIVDKQNGISKRAYGIWDEEVNIVQILGGAFTVPIYVENNVNAFAMAELLYGTGREHDNLMVIKWGPGVGCSIIIDQEIYEGRHSKAAELGHFIVEKNGERCKCGRCGCLETKVSYQALCKIELFEEKEFGEVYRKSKGKPARVAFDEAIDVFARSIINSATIMAPNRIILTGVLFEDESVRYALTTACAGYDESWGEGRVLYSALADRESYIGPAAVCAKQLLFS
ncbi:ROK family protein [Roseburia hominis]